MCCFAVYQKLYYLLTMKYAFLDLGTNTFNLLVVELTEKGIRKLHVGRIPSRLGKGGMKEKMITPEAFDRGIQAIKEHQSTALQYGEVKFHAFATSMIRDAGNGPEFVKQVLLETGITINVVNGEREAELIFKGVCQAFRSEQPFLIMDIGGGSTEFIIAQNKELLWKKSYQLGVTRLYEQFPHSDPMNSAEKETTEKHLFEVMTELFEQMKKYNVQTLVGSAGSFESYAEIIHRRSFGKGIDLSIPAHHIPGEEFKSLLQEVLKSDHAQRTRLEGLIEFRRDLIVMASLLIDTIFRSHPINEVYFSVYSLKEGIMAELIGTE